MTSKPVDIYLRVSRVAGRETLLSPEEQEDKARRFADARHLAVGKVLEADLDQSGTTTDRPSLQLAIQRVRDGISGGIVVMELARFARDAGAGKLVEEIQRLGGSVYAPDAPSDWTTAGGKLQGNLMFAFGQYIADLARERFEYAKGRSIERGVPINSRAPVGYRKRDDRRLEPDPATAAIVREVFERRARGDGPAALGEFLASNGVKTSQGSSTWSKEAIYNLIRNRVYLGEVSYGAERDKRTGERRPRFRNPSAHEALVDLATWTAAQHPNGRQLARPRSPSSSYLLSGLLRCHACRHALQGTRTSRGKRIYRCKRTHAGGICPAPARVSADEVERAAVDIFWQLTEDLEAIGSTAPNPDLDQLREAVERAERQLAQWASPDVQEAVGDHAVYLDGLRERKEKLARVHDALSQAQTAKVASAQLPDIETLRRSWTRMSTERRRELIRLRIDCFVLDRARQLVVYPFGRAPADLPRRGYRRAPTLAPFPDLPADSRPLVLEEAFEESGDQRVRLA